MLNSFDSKLDSVLLHPVSVATTSYLSGEQTEGFPNLILNPISSRPNHRPLRLIAIGHPDDVDVVINELCARGFADIGAWSPAINTTQSGEIMKIMTRFFPI